MSVNRTSSRAAHVEPRHVLEDRVAVGDLALRPVHRVDGVLPRRPGVVLGVPLGRRRPARRPGSAGERGHQLQAGQGGGAARRHHARGVHAREAGEFGRRELPGAPVPGVERVPRRDAQLHAGPLRTGCGAVDPRPRAEAALGQLPLRAGQLLDDLVALRDPSGVLLLLRERDGQAVALQRRPRSARSAGRRSCRARKASADRSWPRAASSRPGPGPGPARLHRSGSTIHRLPSVAGAPSAGSVTAPSVRDRNANRAQYVRQMYAPRGSSRAEPRRPGTKKAVPAGTRFSNRGSVPPVARSRS